MYYGKESTLRGVRHDGYLSGKYYPDDINPYREIDEREAWQEGYASGQRKRGRRIAGAIG